MTLGTKKILKLSLLISTVETVLGKVATTCTEDGHKQTTKTGAQNTVKEIKQYQKKWLQHVQRMDTNRIPKQEHRTQ